MMDTQDHVISADQFLAVRAHCMQQLTCSQQQSCAYDMDHQQGNMHGVHGALNRCTGRI